MEEEKYKLITPFVNQLCYSEALICEFESIYDDEELNRRLKSIQWVYVQVIIINLGKIFSQSPNEPFRLQKFKEISTSIKTDVEKLEFAHADLIKKIKNSRDKLFAHTNKNFYEIGFSLAEIKRLENKFKTNLKIIQAKDKTQERYTPLDLKNDLREIRDLLKEIDAVWKKAILT